MQQWDMEGIDDHGGHAKERGCGSPSLQRIHARRRGLMMMDIRG